MVEFYEDYYTEHPDEARRVTSKDGETIFTDTGDPLLDKWEQELAKGVIPDMEEGLSPEEKERLRKERQKSKRAREQVSKMGFDENYQAGKFDPRFESKYVTPGSKEERQLLKHSRVPATSLLGVSEPTTDAGWEDLLMGGDNG